MLSIPTLNQYFQTHLSESIQELKQLIAQPSVGAQNWGIRECAQLVAQMLAKRGFTVEILETGGSPVVFAERKGRSPKTLLIYDHYDVQPAEPLDLWISPPYEPEVRDGKLFGRGVSDNKGPFAARLLALDAILDQVGELPCNVKFLVEGEEEIGSIHLAQFIEEHPDLLAADACVWESGEVDHREVPLQDLGMRGICYVELSVECLSTDAHSGLGGSIFENAAWRLVWALSTLKGPDERIRLPGFYDKVVPPTPRDIQLLEALPEIAGEYRQNYGVKRFLKGLQGGVDLKVAGVFEPTCTICGLTAGYQGPGTKTVLPARASAKVDFRLVPVQEPAEVVAQLRTHLDAEGFSDVQINFLGGEPAARTDPDDPFVELVNRTAEPVFGLPMQITPIIGGSGPMYPFVHVLKVPVVSAGPGYPGDLAHAPNENMRLDLYVKHALHMVLIMQEFGK